MADLDELRARMDKLGERLAEIRGRAPEHAGNANMREMTDRHARLRARLREAQGAPEPDETVAREVDELLNAFDRWATEQDREFGQR